MRELHRYVAYLVPGGFALMVVIATYAYIRNREAPRLFWSILAVVQVVLGLQVLIGAVLFAGGGRPNSNGPVWLHYVYGGLFPAAVLVVAHRFARRHEGIEVIVFGFAALVAFGLTFRALQTGLGID